MGNTEPKTKLNKYIEEALAAESYTSEQSEARIWGKISNKINKKPSNFFAFREYMFAKLAILVIAIFSITLLVSQDIKTTSENDLLIASDPQLQEAEKEIDEKVPTEFLAFEDTAITKTETVTIQNENINEECDSLIKEIDETMMIINPEIDFPDFDL